MRSQAMVARSLVMLCALSGPSLAEVTVSQSNNPNAGYAAPLRQLFAGERSMLNAAPPLAVRALAPSQTPRPAARPAAQAAAAQAAAASLFDEAFLAAQPPASGGSEWACLTQALYFEARGESPRGQFAVAEVVLNRVATANYPDTVCGVVRQGASRLNGCQFSFACDGKPEVVRERDAWELAGKISRLVLDGKHRLQTFGATHFHTVAVSPKWARVFPRTAKIGTHLFYRQPGAAVPQAAANQPERPDARLAAAEVSRRGASAQLSFGLPDSR